MKGVVEDAEIKRMQKWRATNLKFIPSKYLPQTGACWEEIQINESVNFQTVLIE